MDLCSFDRELSRRRFLKAASLSLVGALVPFSPLLSETTGSASETMATRPIPSSGEPLPVIGLGTWQQFDVSSDPTYLKPLRRVLKTLFRAGGSVIDTSPMYGQAESVLGTLLSSMENPRNAFLATKVWTRGRKSGIRQMESSMNKLKTSTIDLMQIHNLVDWRTHLPTLQKWKDEGRLRYIGITHYTRSAFDSLRNVMVNHDIDFVQLPYSIDFRDAENELLPIASERNIAVVVNRPFEAGRLFRQVRSETLPDWVQSFDCDSWAQFFLKFILGHDAVTCVIPGTSDPEHMLDNARAGMGTIPNSRQRERMINHWQSL